MKISQETIEVLKNFTTINQSIYVKPGNVLRTISPTKAIFAVATVTDEFKMPFGIYNLSQFLACLSMMQNPELDFQSKVVTISNNDGRLDYYYCDENVVMSAPQSLNMPTGYVDFTLKGNDLANVLKAMNILELPEIAIVGDGNKITVEVFNSKIINDTTKSNTYRVKVGDTDKTFRAVFKGENLKMTAIDHDVVMSPKGIAKFTGPMITYYVTVEANASTWG